MDRWHVYNWLKQCYITTSKISPSTAIKHQFPNIPVEELYEGILEFILNMGGND